MTPLLVLGAGIGIFVLLGIFVNLFDDDCPICGGTGLRQSSIDTPIKCYMCRGSGLRSDWDD